MYIICLWVIWIFFCFQLWFDLHMCLLIDRNIWGIGDERLKTHVWVKYYGIGSIWSERSMFDLKYMLRYIRSDVYHLSVSDLNIFWFLALISSSHVTFHWLKYLGCWGWGVKAHGWVKKNMVSFVFGVRGRCLAWNPS